MSKAEIAGKLTTIAENQQRVYDSGYEKGKAAGGGTGGETLQNPLEYATNIGRLYQNADFPDGYEMTLRLPNSPAALDELFRAATGLETLTVLLPTGDTAPAYSANYFLSGTSSRKSTTKTIRFRDIDNQDAVPTVRFSLFTSFTYRAETLESVDGIIDLSESTSNANCFASCKSLKDLLFKENSIAISISFADSPNLSDDSIASIIDGLANLTGQTAQTLTLNAAVTANLDTDQMSAVALKNWNIA